MIKDSLIGSGLVCHHPDQVNIYGATIGNDCKIGAFVEIGAGVIIGNRCKIQTGAFIPPGIRIGDDCFIGPHAVFPNCRRPNHRAPMFEPVCTFVGDQVRIGANATILPGLTLCKGCFVGAGAVVTRNVGPHKTVIGNPAREMAEYWSGT